MELLTDTLRAAVLTAHLLTNALAGAGPLLAALLRCFSRVRSEEDGALRQLAVASVVALGAGLAIGVISTVVLCWDSESAFRAAVMRVPASAYAMLATEWVFTLVLMAVYLGTWRALANRPLLHGLIALIAASNLLYHFPTMMVVIGRLAVEPTFAAEAEITRPVFRRLITTPDLLAKTCHYWSLCLLVGGLGAASAAKKGPRGVLARCGGGAALIGLALVLLTGVLSLTQAGAGVQRSLIGGDALATLAFSAAVAASLGLAYTLLPLATGDTESSATPTAILLTIAATFLMAFASAQTVAPAF